MSLYLRQVHLTRLTKKFEESARVTADEVMQSAAAVEDLNESANPQLLSDTARNYLPRWSSAPSCLQSVESGDALDGLITPFVPGGGNRSTMFPMISMNKSSDQRKVQQMMSNPI